MFCIQQTLTMNKIKSKY